LKEKNTLIILSFSHEPIKTKNKGDCKRCTSQHSTQTSERGSLLSDYVCFHR